jgi:predicted porin
MQKKIIALAVAAAAAGFASAPVLAQSTVTLYGSIDAGLRNTSNVTADGKSVTKMSNNGNYNSNRLGFKDSEDLGNGMQAHFVLETGFNNGTGAEDTASAAPTILFNRSAYVGFGGGWGNVDLGRQYTVIFKTIGNYDPFNYKYTNAMIPLAGLDGARHNNEIQYQGAFNGLNVLASYATGEVAGSSSASSPTEIGLNYAAGPVSFGGAYMSGKDATNTLKTTQWTVGGAYAFAPFRVAVGYDDTQADQTALPNAERKVWWVGGSYNISSAAAVSLAYYGQKFQDFGGTAAANQGNNKFWILGGTYALSKRTNFYADYDNRKLDGNQVIGGFGAAQTQDSQNGFSVGINHLF